MSRSVRRSERGAMIIMVALALLGLTVFSAFVLDQGVIYASRRQAQNAADAGAMSAAVNLMWNPVDANAAGVAARKMANANAVWGQAPLTPDILVQTGLTCPPGTGGGPGCVRVDVHRGTTDRNGGVHTNVLPTFFANLMGINSQRISATAMAQVTSGNAVQCIKPWILPDKWIDNNESAGGWSIDDTFHPDVAPADTYDRAQGFKYPDNQGTEVLLKGDANEWSSGWVQEIELGGGNGASVYREEIEGCPSWVPTVKIYDGSVPCASRSDTDPENGCVNVRPGVAQGPTTQGVAALVALDTATWNTSTSSVNSTCMTNDTCRDFYGNYVAISPRIVPVALFNPQAYWDLACNGNNCVAQVSNIFGFFLEGMCDDVYPNQATRPAFCGSNSEARKTVVGRMMQYPGQYNGGSTVSSFAKAIRLVR